MPVDAKTIQIFLPDGEPRVVRIAEITTRIVQAVQVPRARLDRIMQRPELDHIGVYFLFGESDEKAKPVAYIGQTEARVCSTISDAAVRSESAREDESRTRDQSSGGDSPSPGTPRGRVGGLCICGTAALGCV